MSMTNPDVARALTETADLLEIQGANSFRVRAYRNAAHAIEDLVDSVSDLVAENPASLRELPGIGADIALKMQQLVQTGTFPLLEELRSEFPPGLLQVMRIPGLGPKKAGVLFHELKIQSLDDLKAAAEQGRISVIKGFGKKTEQSILEGLSQVASHGNRVLISQARAAAERIEADLRTLSSVHRVAIAGSCRRRRETCRDLDMLATAESSREVMDALAKHPLVHEVLSRGETKQRVRLRDGIEMDLRVVPEESFGAALVYFTGSKDHNIVLRKRAVERGLKINEYGVFKGEERVAGTTEEEVYETVDLPWIPPELRENRGEIEKALEGNLPELITLDDIRGDLHMHTNATDGVATIEEMVEAAIDWGLEYIAITDHSKRVTMANGLDAMRLREHWDHIREVSESYKKIHVLLGIECDILENAELDLPDDVLAEADWVIAVLHYGLKQPREQVMKRLLNAVQNPHVDVIGHPSGRLIGKRAPAAIDFKTLFKAAADHNVMMEINANPARLDLDDLQAAAAKDHGIPIVINTDAHSQGGLDVMEYGVDQARRAGLTADDVANTRTFAKFRKMLKS